MKKIGIINPLIPIISLGLLFLFGNLISNLNFQDNLKNIGFYILIAFLTILFLIVPIVFLSSIKLLIVREDQITVVYLFRFQTKTFLIKELKSVFSQKEETPWYHLCFTQTYLYFGNENRLKFNSIEFLNYRVLHRHLENLNSLKK